MSETERLRAMLDERGVEYETDDAQVSDTEWYYVTKLRDGYSDRWTYEEPSDCDLLVSYQYDLGAEEAIAATLGPCNDSCNCTNGERTGERIDLDAPTLGVTDVKGIRLDGAGTCHVMTIGEFNGEGTEYYDYCSNCGYEFDDDPLNYCPNCGRRIEVDDD